ncbi:c-type cytochrome [Parvibium lacunae]|uniref:Cytochrome c n=1 Tax=Parvibium lacunae TaxID=1888893 RepID=A0A368L527_9BURK|nr:cytochrome c [Parvibium lacunae]RCS58689.1 cytochrome c [Parvibium lacunae]
MTKTITLIALLTASLGAMAADKAAGQKLADAQCAACHAKVTGNDKDWNVPLDPSYPKLAGQKQDYLLQALKDYKSGARKNAIMAGQVEKLSKKDLENLSAYFASLKGTLSYR